MPPAPSSVKPFTKLSPIETITWRTIQGTIWFAGLAIFICLIFYPRIGLTALWNVLIPIAPALLVVACGVWRNICPLATTNLLARHFNLSKKAKMPVALQAKLQLAAIIALYIIVPLRHLLFNTNGIATAILLFLASAASVAMGFVYDWKSGWCNSLCPVHPVEKLYGANTLFAIPNAHCHECVNCSVPCPDSTPNIHPSVTKKTIYNKISGVLTAGGLPGFIFGWFFLPDYTGPLTFAGFFEVYKWPFLGLCISMLLYLSLRSIFKTKANERVLINCFAAAGVSCYYWFRIPALLGFGKFSTDVPLFHLENILPGWCLLAATLCTTAFFFWWLVFRKPHHNSWVIRPQYASRIRQAELRKAARPEV